MDRRLFAAGIAILLTSLPNTALLLTTRALPQPWPVDVSVVLVYPAQVFLGGYVLIRGLWPSVVTAVPRVGT